MFNLKSIALLCHLGDLVLVCKNGKLFELWWHIGMSSGSGSGNPCSKTDGGENIFSHPCHHIEGFMMYDEAPRAPFYQPAG